MAGGRRTHGVLVGALDRSLRHGVRVVIRPADVQHLAGRDGLVRHRHARKLRVGAEAVAYERDVLLVDDVDVLDLSPLIKVLRDRLEVVRRVGALQAADVQRAGVRRERANCSAATVGM
jgi:hypothetical protein